MTFTYLLSDNSGISNAEGIEHKMPVGSFFIHPYGYYRVDECREDMIMCERLYDETPDHKTLTPLRYRIGFPYHLKWGMVWILESYDVKANTATLYTPKSNMKTKKSTFKTYKLSELPYRFRFKAQLLDPLCTTETKFKLYNDDTGHFYSIYNNYAH